MEVTIQKFTHTEITQRSHSLEPCIWANVKGRKKKLMPTCMPGWMQAALKNGNEFPAGLDMCAWNSLVFDMSSSKSWLCWWGVHSCAVYRGLVFSPTRRLLQPPLKHRRHLVIIDSFFSLYFFLNLYGRLPCKRSKLVSLSEELNLRCVICMNNKPTVLQHIVYRAHLYADTWKLAMAQ